MCEKSLTYMLESTDLGFVSMLLGLWTAHGPAKLEGREFFISDKELVSLLDLPFLLSVVFFFFFF